MTTDTTQAPKATRFDDMPDVMRPAEAARLMRVGRNTMYEMVREGRVPAVRVGRRLLIPKRAIERLLNEAA